MQPRKLLFCIDSLARSGTELQLIGLIERLDRARFTPYLLTIRPSDPQLVPEDCRHLEWQVPRIFSPAGLLSVWRLSRLMRREGFHVVQTFFQDATILGGVAARLAGVPVRLASLRDMGFWRTPVLGRVMRLVFRLMTGFICNARIVRDHFVEQDGLNRADIRVIYNGIEGESLNWIEHQGPTLQIGIVGNLTREVKRTDLFIEAARLVAADHPEVTWHIIGDGALRPRLEALAAESDLMERTVFAGRIDDVPRYLETLQVGVICSDSEGFCNALLEYMFKGCAAVATAVGGNPEAITDEVTGFLVPPGDPAALAGALNRLIEDPSLRRRLARAARERAEADFSWERCVVAHEEVYGSEPRIG